MPLDSSSPPVLRESSSRHVPTRVRSKWSRKNPYRATVVANTVLSGPGSDKEVRHIVLSLGDSGIEYQPGDGINVWPVNDPDVVARIIDRLGVAPDTPVADRRTTRALCEALTHGYEVCTAPEDLLRLIACRTGNPELNSLVADDVVARDARDTWLAGKDVLDLLEVDRSVVIAPEELIAQLRPLVHRQYSISSSPLVHGSTVHLTMATVRHDGADRRRGGTCSTFVADRRPAGTEVDVFVSANRAFRLPPDDIKAIMIGPGTGIAPFRAFLHERAARRASGGNWLFFGDRHREHDHIYADEIEGFVADGLLSRVDLAFSRDQEHKIYVQDRMREQGAALYAWLSEGAHIYVCGDATRMAPDVDTALLDIIAEHGGLSTTAAHGVVDELRRTKRYVRDVY